MVPVFVDGVLPPGEWPASWAEVEASFGGSDWRVLSMKERVRLVGGTLDVTTAPGRGTHIEVDVPLAGNAHV